MCLCVYGMMCVCNVYEHKVEIYTHTACHNMNMGIVHTNNKKCSRKIVRSAETNFGYLCVCVLALFTRYACR